MKKNKITTRQITLTSIVLTGAITVAMSSGKFTVWSTIIGIILLLILMVYYFKVKNKFFRYLTLGSIITFCLVIAFGFLLNCILDREWLIFGIWAIISLFIALLVYLYKR